MNIFGELQVENEDPAIIIEPLKLEQIKHNIKEYKLLEEDDQLWYNKPLYNYKNFIYELCKLKQKRSRKGKKLRVTDVFETAMLLVAEEHCQHIMSAIVEVMKENDSSARDTRFTLHSTNTNL